MPKIPLTKTIEDAYGFTFKNLLSVLGVGWLPIVISLVPFYFIAGPYMAALETLLTTEDFSGFLPLLPQVFAITIICMVMFSMLIIGLTGLVMGELNTTVYFYFSLGSRVWRFLGAMVLSYLGFMVVVGIAVFAGTLTVDALGDAAGPLVGLGTVVLFFALFYFMLRIFFFLAPVTVAEGHSVISRSFQLGGGNAWRIFVLALVSILPTTCIQSIAQGSIMGQSMMEAPAPAEDPTPEQVMAMMNESMEQFMELLPILIPI